MVEEPAELRRAAEAAELETMYREVAEGMLKQGQMLTHEEFMAIGFPIIVPVQVLLKMRRDRTPFVTMSQVARRTAPPPNVGTHRRLSLAKGGS